MLIAALVLVVIVMVSSIWLTVEGFKKHILWGIGMLFVPFVVLIFTAMNWSKAKKPFLTYLISSVLLAAVIFEPMTVVINESVQLSEQVERGEITQQQAQEIIQKRMVQLFSGDPVTANNDYDLLTPEEQRIETLREELRIKNEAAIASQEYAEEQAKKIEEIEEVRRKVKVFTAIEISEANKYIGKIVRIVSFEGVERQGTLINAGYDRLNLDRKLAGGRFKFDVLTKDIEVLEVQQFELR
ncbi:MAG: hypothetical protein KAT25_04275 [Sulfuriflexus sp.]|nr:hypothetical protein [Sulfuriflexus sp.]